MQIIVGFYLKDTMIFIFTEFYLMLVLLFKVQWFS